MANKVNASFMIDPDLLKQMDAVARAQGISRSNLLGRWIRDHVASEQDDAHPTFAQPALDPVAAVERGAEQRLVFALDLAVAAATCPQPGAVERTEPARGLEHLLACRAVGQGVSVSPTFARVVTSGEREPEVGE